MRSPKATLRIALVLGAMVLLVRSFTEGRYSWMRLQHPERTAPNPISIIHSDHATRAEIETMNAATRRPLLDKEDELGRQGLAIAAYTGGIGLLVLALCFLPWWRNIQRGAPLALQRTHRE
jgi:hypothetical protein